MLTFQACKAAVKVNKLFPTELSNSCSLADVCNGIKTVVVIKTNLQ